MGSTHWDTVLSLEIGSQMWSLTARSQAGTYRWEKRERDHPIKGKEHVQRHKGMRQHGCMRNVPETKKGNHWEGVWVHAMRPGIPWFAVIPMLPPMRKLFFISSLTPQRSIEDKGTGWRDGNQPGHSVKKEVKPVLKRKAEMRLLWLFLPKVQS